MTLKSIRPFNLLIILVLGSGCVKKSVGETYTNCKLPIANGNVGVSLGGFPRNSNRLPSTGTVNATVIMVDFPDAPAVLTPAAAFAKVSGAPATFAEVSYSRLTYNMTPVLQWFRMSKASTQYALGNGEVKAYIQEAVNLADPTVSFATTDSLIVLTNPDATGIGTTGPAFVSAPGNGITTADGVELVNAAASAYDLNTWGSIWLNHEVTHTLGLVDLYILGESTLTGALRNVGGFSYMGFNSFTSNAPGLSAWERWVLGWLDDAQVNCYNPKISGPTTTLITPIENSGGQKAIVVPTGNTKAVVVESRRAIGIDAGIAKTGALVYTVDTSIQSGHGPMAVFPKGTDALFTQSPRAAGESVTVEGIKVEVLSSDASGDTVRISADHLWIDR